METNSLYQVSGRSIHDRWIPYRGELDDLFYVVIRSTPSNQVFRVCIDMKKCVRRKNRNEYDQHSIDALDAISPKFMTPVDDKHNSGIL